MLLTLVKFFVLFISICHIPAQAVSALENNATEASVHLRIEGSQHTLFEGRVLTHGHVVTTPSGGAHECNGLNNNTNSKPGPTPTTALDDAAHLAHFTFDGTFFSDFDDFLITRIGPDAQTDNEFWGLLLNFQFDAVGGCQQEVRSSDRVLWAFNAFNVDAFLELEGQRVLATGQIGVFTVTDGSTGKPVAGASVGGKLSDEAGHVALAFTDAGEHGLKASKNNTIRSNELVVVTV